MNDASNMFGAILYVLQGPTVPYKDRQVATWPENENWVVDTCRVTDNKSKPFETAVRHERYNGGLMVIVEEYTTKELAQVGHDKWVTLMSAVKLPDSLTDVSTCAIARLLKDAEEI